MNIDNVYAAFGLSGTLKSLENVKNGNINNTYKAVFSENGADNPYVLQRINSYVFKNPADIMHNIDMITTHIKQRYADQGLDSDRAVLDFLPTVDGKKYFIDDEQSFWRCCHFIKNSVTYNLSSDLKVLRNVGEAFGRFQLMLSDFNAEELREIIPDFHNTKKRLDTFFNDVDLDPVGRVAEVEKETAFLSEKRAITSRLSQMLEKGAIPLRVTHNDTKCNNVLFDADTKEPLVVIDLDTVMPGLVAHDFGDGVRFAANSADEDETDISKVQLDLDKYEAFTKGFIKTVAPILTPIEIDTMALGAITITVELASRFLDDYITGDKYFKIKYPEHNLVRARCQIALAQDMERKFDAMNQIVRSYV